MHLAKEFIFTLLWLSGKLFAAGLHALPSQHLMLLAVAFNPLDRVLLQLSPYDAWTGRDACEGCLITGSPGSGKSSTAFMQIAMAYLMAGFGGLILASKPEEPKMWLEYARRAKREKDVILFSADSGHCFDPLHYVFHRPGRGAGDIEAVIGGLNTLIAIGKPKSGSGSNDRFWELETERLLRPTIRGLQLAGKPVSMVSMNEFVQSLPSSRDEHKAESWQKGSYCAEVLADIRKRIDQLSPAEQDDLDMVVRYVCDKWPNYDERTRTNVLATWFGLSDRFLWQPFRRMFSSGKCTFVPEMVTHERKIIISDFPMLEYGIDTGRIANCLLKEFFAAAWLRRDVQKHPNIVFLAQDELQHFILPRGRDNFISQTCRSARVAVLAATQNIMQIAEEFGENRADAKTKSWLGNLALKIAFQQNDVDTNTYFADLIGKNSQFMRHIGLSGQDPTYSEQEQIRHRTEPETFSSLKKPDSYNPIAQAIVHHSGRRFKATRSADQPLGSNFLVAEFSREFPKVPAS